MLSPRLLILLPIAGAALLAGGCAIADDGPRATQTRHVAAFTRIDTHASVDLRLHVGRPQSVEVHAGRKVIDEVDTVVSGGTLVVTFDHHGLGGRDVVVDASVPRLGAVSTEGSGDVEADGIDARDFQVRSQGSGDVALSGTADRLTVDLEGSGDAHVGTLTARDARVSLKGSGDADVRADDRLDVSVDGSGDVHYRGHPTVTQNVDGSGDISSSE